MSHIAIVGGGLAGLSAALELKNQGHQPTIFERSQAIGGRVATEHVEGYLLDVGFQVLLDSYPEITSDWKKGLELASFCQGAHVNMDGEWKLVSNPLTDPLSIKKWPKGTFRGFLALLAGFMKSTENQTTNNFIDNLSASPEWLEGFLKPFMRGVFLEKELSTRAERFIELMHYFRKGRACLPKKGMQEIPNWLMDKISGTDVRLNTRVVNVTESSVTLEGEPPLPFDGVIVAVSLPEQKKLISSTPTNTSCSTTCDYFSLEGEHPFIDRYLWLDGRPDSIVNNFCFLSAVQPHYAPEGYHLLSASTIGQPVSSVGEVQTYLADQLGINGERLTPIKRYTIDHALPAQSSVPPLSSPFHEGIYLAGEAVSSPSINDAIASGRAAAEALVEDKLGGYHG